ncbi:MAG: peptide chain release factor N(5)-glutamine methyltransferase [Clostridia bacterium]|nr:peptide chain release factor N(5)-glutamine methyltransferase [Clostridia bacterium]
MKIKELIAYGRKMLNENNIEDSNIIAKSLAKYILEMDDSKIIINEDKEVEENNRIRYYLSLIEIVDGRPLQYITNKQNFMGLEFYVDENVLIPQPDTEILVEEVINACKSFDEVHVLDICTGSGAIGISIAKNVNDATVTLSDISNKALEIAKKNAKQNDVNVSFIESDMFENISEKFDIIVSNPPYIKTEVIQTLDKGVQNEPYIALDGGKDGLDFYRILVEKSKEYLNNGGMLIMEIGYDQKEDVEKLLVDSGYSDVYSKKDLSGNDRIVAAKI